jgi:hypothetical protein
MNFAQVYITVTEDTEAAAIRVETDSGNETELKPQDRSVGDNDTVGVRVDPDGDAVTVFAVNNEGAAGELLSQSVPTDELSETAADAAVPEGALSFSYAPPNGRSRAELTVDVVTDTEAETLIAQPQEALTVAGAGRVGSLTSDETISAGTTLTTVVEPDGDEVIVYASVDGATGEVARWQGPE